MQTISMLLVINPQSDIPLSTKEGLESSALKQWSEGISVINEPAAPSEHSGHTRSALNAVYDCGSTLIDRVRLTACGWDHEIFNSAHACMYFINSMLILLAENKIVSLNSDINMSSKLTGLE